MENIGSKNGNTYAALQKAVSALSELRRVSEITDHSENNIHADLIRTNIVKNTDWESFTNCLGGLGTTLNSLSVQRYVK